MTTGGHSIQERFEPESRCFGCGPANELGLRIRSFPAGDGAEDPLVCDWTPSAHHQAFPNVLNGGIVGALLDCHSNWTAGWYLMRRDGLERPPLTVTRDFHVTLKRPTPMDAGPLHLEARAVAGDGNEVTVEATLETAGGKVTATCVGRFVAVERSHPAFAHR